MHRLLLDDNELDDVSADKLSLGLIKNGVMEELDLGFNYIGDTGSAKLLEAGNNCATLTILSLGKIERIMLEKYYRR